MVLTAGVLVQRLTGLDCSSHIASLLTKINQESRVSGDLGSKLTPAVSSLELSMRYTWAAEHLSNNYLGNNGIADIWTSQIALFNKRIIVFGDSFLRAMGPILSFFFKEILFLRTPYFHTEMVEQMQPDYILTGNVERYLTNVLSDQDRPPFFLFPYLQEPKSDYQPPADFVAALSAILSYPRRRYSTFAALGRNA
jgi:hypothetical protein